MRLYSLYTDSIQWQVDEFLKPSIPPSFDSNFYWFDEEGQLYKDIIVERNLKILKTIERHHGEIIAWVDTDIQFFDDNIEEILIEQMERDKLDLLYQHELKGKICCGFQVIRCSDATYQFYMACRDGILNIFRHRELVDQAVVQRKLRYGAAPVKWGVMPDHVVWCPRRNDWALYHPDKEYDIPDNICCHHASWTREYKREQLERVRDFVKSRKNQIPNLDKTD
jgi:hypothetical protein